MKPPRPSATLTLGGRTLTAAEAGLISLRVTLTRGAHDGVDLTLWSRTRFASASPADALAVKLGFVDEEEDVWSGEVASVETSAGALRISGLAPTAALSRTRKSQTYVGQTVADVVRDLAADVDIDTIEGDQSLEYYAVDHRRSVWGHLLDLAELSGSEITCSATGGLRFTKVQPLPSPTSFRFGAEILAWLAGTSPEGSSPSFSAHGSASENGSEKWHWLNPDPSSGAGGSQTVGGFHSRSLAESLTTAVAERVKRSTLSGDVELVGQSALRVGDVFSLTEVSSGDIGPLRALRIVHVLNSAHGFRSVVRVEGV